MREFAWQVLAKQPIGQKQGANDGQRYAHDASRGFKDQTNKQQPHDQVTGGQLTGALNQIPFEVPLVCSRRHSRKAQQPGKGLPRPTVANE
ncbi:hypothetical protein D3C80_739940 [compost metagenome]